MGNVRNVAVGIALGLAGCATAPRAPVMEPTKAPIGVKFAAVVVTKAQDVKTPGSPGGIEGVITDEQGGALGGATIGLTGNAVAKSTTTDPAGKFRFKKVKAGDYVLDLRYAEAPLELEVTVLKGQTKKLTLTVESKQKMRAQCHAITSAATGGPTAAIQGVIGDQAGQPLAHVTVIAATATEEKVASSGDNGAFTIEGLPPGSYVVRFSRGERFQAERRLEVAAGTRYRVVHTFDLLAAAPPPPCD